MSNLVDHAERELELAGLFDEDSDYDGMSETEENSFYEELRTLLNRHSKENQCDTPDYILASYMEKCLSAFEQSVLQRDAWHGKDL